MKIAATPSNGTDNLCLFDTETKEEKRVAALPEHLNNEFADDLVNGPSHRPYGITWNADNVFVGIRRNLVVYDSELNAVDMLEVLGDNTHQLTCHKGLIVSVQTSRICIGFYNPATGESKLYHMREGWVDNAPCLMKDDRDIRVNSVLSMGDSLYIAGNDPSSSNQLWELNTETDTLSGPTVFADGWDEKIHGLFCTSGDHFFALATTGLIAKPDGLDHALTPLVQPMRDHEAKGMCGDEAEWACGLSEHNYTAPGAYIQVYKDFRTHPEPESHFILGVKKFQDLRRIDGPDKCHLNRFSFPYKGF